MKKPSMRTVFATMFSPVTTFWPGFKQAANWLMKEDIHMQTYLPLAYLVSYEVEKLESGAERLKFKFDDITGDEAYAEFLKTIPPEQSKKWPSTLGGLNDLVERKVIERQKSTIDLTASRIREEYRYANREDRALLREMILELGADRSMAKAALLAAIEEIELGATKVTQPSEIRTATF